MAINKKNFSIGTAATVVGLLVGAFTLRGNINTEIDNRIKSVAETVARDKIASCPQIQKVDTVYKMLELNTLQHVEIKNAVQSLNAMLVFLNSNNPKFLAYQAAQNTPELIGPR